MKIKQGDKFKVIDTEGHDFAENQIVTVEDPCGPFRMVNCKGRLKNGKWTSQLLKVSQLEDARPKFLRRHYKFRFQKNTYPNIAIVLQVVDATITNLGGVFNPFEFKIYRLPENDQYEIETYYTVPNPEL